MQLTPTQSVFEKVLAMPVLHHGGHDAALVHVWWSAPQQGHRLVQVYVNGELCDVSVDVEQRELWLLLDRRYGHHISLLAVPANHETSAWTNHSRLLDNDRRAFDRRATAAIVAKESLPIDTQIAVALDGQKTGTHPLWDDDSPRSGFGSLFGLGDFGFDAATGPGLGHGQLGAGPLGADGAAWQWRNTRLATGQHTLVLTLTDRDGHAVSPGFEKQFDITPLPAPAINLTLTSNATLIWTAGDLQT